jgi:tetratricopeptide (TPR) repeat protein
MRVLSKKDWSLFISKNNSFDGILFEELVGMLLNEQFSGHWQQTQPSWDGGKDFEKEHDDGVGYSWAECKIYGKTISIRTISNTLVMAVNEENVKEILIFSYSKLNDNALSHLGDFSAATEIKINVFDDERLEILILRSKGVLDKYFSGLQVTPYQITPFAISSFLSNTPHIERAMLNEQLGIQKSRKALFEINSTCLFEIFIVSNQNLILIIDFRELLKKKELLGLLNYKHLLIDKYGKFSITLSEGQVESLKLYFAPSKAGIFNFPQITASNSINNAISELGEMQYEVSRVHYPPLIGGRILSLLENDFRARISANHQTFCLTISGKSGVGKTRFLHECKRLLFRENYSVRHFDCHSASYRTHNTFIRALLAQVWRLPYPISNGFDDTSAMSAQNKKGNIYDQLHNILYHIDAEVDLSSKEQLEILCSLIVRGILRQRMGLIIDNVQHLEESSINLLQMVYRNLVNAPGQNVLLLSFNQEDLLFSDAALSFHMLIKENAAKRVDNELFYELEEFSESQIEQFLNSVLKNDDPEDDFTNHYPTLTQLVKDNILPRPLDLWQFILAARDEDVIFLDDGYFFIQDEIRFVELIKTIQKSTGAIFEYRLKKLSHEKVLIEILYLIANMGDVNSLILNQLNYSDDQIQKLVDTGILRNSAGDRIEFFHPSIEKYVVRRLNDGFLFESSVRDLVYETFLRSDFSPLFPITTFLLNPLPSEVEIIEVIKFLRNNEQGFPSERIRLASKKVREHLLYSSKIAPIEYIDMVNQICTMSAKDSNKTDWLKYMQEFKKQLSNFVPETKAQARHYFYITREICSASTSSFQAWETINELEKAIEEMRLKLNHLPFQVYSELRANFLNRQCVCYKNLKRIDDALRIGKEAKEMAIESESYGLACLCIVDLGYVYFSEATNKEKMLDFWDEAIEFYNQNKSKILEQIPVMEYVILLIEGCCYGLRGDYRKSLKCLDKLVNSCYEAGSLFYLLQGKLTKAIMISRELLEAKQNTIYNYKNVVDIARSVEDSAAAAQMIQFYRYSLHLQAIVWNLMGKFDKAAVCVTGLLRILSSQESKKPGTLSFSDEMIIWDAWDFQALETTTSDSKHVLNVFLSHDIPKGKRENSTRPYSVFSVDKVNLPLH